MSTIYTEAEMIQGARIQYRNYFKVMALGGRWVLYRAAPGETLSGVVLAPINDVPDDTPALVDSVQGYSENQMVILLSNAIRYGAHPLLRAKQKNSI